MEEDPERVGAEGREDDEEGIEGMRVGVEVDGVGAGAGVESAAACWRERAVRSAVRRSRGSSMTCSRVGAERASACEGEGGTKRGVRVRKLAGRGLVSRAPDHASTGHALEHQGVLSFDRMAIITSV